MRPFCVLEPPFGAVRDNVPCSSWAHWKARGGLPISGPTKSRPEPSGTVRSRPDAARSRPDIVRMRPTPPGAVQRPPHQTRKCPRIRLQLGVVNISKLWAALDHIYFILHGMMMLHKLWLKISGKGGPPPITFAWIVRVINALQLCRWQFSHKETL